MKLHAQGLELRLGQLCGKLRGAQLAFSIARVVKIALGGGNNDPVRHQVLMEHVNQRHAPGKSEKVAPEKIIQRPYEESDAHTGKQVNGQAARPAAALQRK